MKATPRSFGSQLKTLREGAGFTQEELATIAGLSVHAVSALERGERRRPHFETMEPFDWELGAERTEVNSRDSPAYRLRTGLATT